MNISTKVVFLAHFASLMGYISTLENSEGYSKIGCYFRELFLYFSHIFIIIFTIEKLKPKILKQKKRPLIVEIQLL
jgi:hypothetical protein